MFCYCSNCRRYYRDALGHNCPAPAVVKPKRIWSWQRPWHAPHRADAIIARKFRKCRTAPMF